MSSFKYFSTLQLLSFTENQLSLYGQILHNSKILSVNNKCFWYLLLNQELSQQLSGVKERLGELHRDVTLLRRAHTPPLAARFEHVTRECAVLEEQLERHQVELERLKNVFDTLWEEQLCRIHVEQEIFQSQVIMGNVH